MKTRPIKKLLILLRDFLPTNINSSTRFGGSICYSIIDMCSDHIITPAERSKLLNCIEKNKPSHIKKDDEGFWWSYGKLEPRMEFLDKLISKR